jgi:hypothetical protein
MANCKDFKIVFAQRTSLKAVALSMILVGLAIGESAIAQERSQCFMVGANGELIDLASVCSPPPAISNNRVTGPAPEQNPTSEQNPTPDATQEPPTNPTSSSDNGKKPANSNFRSAGNSSGLTQSDNTEATRRVSRKRQRESQRRDAASK